MKKELDIWLQILYFNLGFITFYNIGFGVGIGGFGIDGFDIGGFGLLFTFVELRIVKNPCTLEMPMLFIYGVSSYLLVVTSICKYLFKAKLKLPTELTYNL